MKKKARRTLPHLPERCPVVLYLANVKMKQTWLAERMELRKNTVWRYLNGLLIPPDDRVVEMARLTGVDVELLRRWFAREKRRRSARAREADAA